jgi:molybdate transport system ATP-binding protein
MSVEIRIKKNLGAFTLNIDYKGDGRRIGILGSSGSGKSLTLKCIAGIEAPDEGYIAFDDRVIYDSANKVNPIPQKRRVGYLFQNYALFPNMTAWDNIAAGVKGSKKERTAKVNEVIERFSLTELANRLPSQLSGGQQQRVALARIIASEPEVILLDEPFSALDAYMREEMQRSLTAMLSEFNGVVIMVSHSRDEIYEMSDELIVIDNGAVAASGITSDIFKKPGNATAAMLTGCKNIAKARQTEGGILVEDWAVELKLSKAVDETVSGVAVRAHEFSFDKERGSLVFDVIEPEVREELFEYSIFFKPSNTAANRVCMKVSAYMWNRENGVPDKVYLSEDSLLLLRDVN